MSLFDRLRPSSDVTVYLRSAGTVIFLEFAREVDSTVAQWLTKLERQPFVKNIVTSSSRYEVFLNRNWDTAQAAEAIAQSLEQEHNFTVARQITELRDLGERRSVERFAEI